MDRLSPLDAWFLHVEDGVDHMHMALVGVLEGPAPDHDTVLADVADRLDRIPRYRQRVRWAPLDLVNPVWVDDDHFDVTHHVRRVAAAPPGDDAALAEVVGRLIELELDRGRPLWEIWVVDDLAEGNWGLLTKVHHSLTDGVGGSALMAALMDLVPDAPSPPASTWRPARPPSTLRVVADGTAGRLWEVASHTLRRPPAPGPLVETLRDAAAGTLAYAHDLLPTPPTVLNGRLHAQRRWWPATVSRADLDAVRAHHHVSFNDVALTAIAGGLRDLLQANGEDVADRDVRSLVPVSRRRPDRDGALHNVVAAMVADLPVGLSNPTLRLGVVHARLQALKTSGEAQLTSSLLDLSGQLPWPPVTGALRLTARLLHTHVQRNINTVTTNVPGPPVPLWWMGHRILRAWPVVPIGESVRLGVAIFSYQAEVTFGITTDAVALPDGHLVARGIERDMAAMAAALPRGSAGTSSGRDHPGAKGGHDVGEVARVGAPRALQ